MRIIAWNKWRNKKKKKEIKKIKKMWKNLAKCEKELEKKNVCEEKKKEGNENNLPVHFLNKEWTTKNT